MIPDWFVALKVGDEVTVHSYGIGGTGFSTIGKVTGKTPAGFVTVSWNSSTGSVRAYQYAIQQFRSPEARTKRLYLSEPTEADRALYAEIVKIRAARDTASRLHRLDHAPGDLHRLWLDLVPHLDAIRLILNASPIPSVPL